MAAHKTDDQEDREILRELCAINGVNFENLERGSGLKVTKLESFFFGCPHIPTGISFFPALTELRIVNQKFTHISGLECCVGLKQLWICEGQVQRIEGLSKCINLTGLYLYTNRIAQIEGLEQLTKLKCLWLNGNQISSIEGLECLLDLRELNLAHNRLTVIGNSLNHLSQLVQLNLSGNLLCSLQDLVHLSTLSNLTTLSLCDPLYPPNPVCTLCNYSTHIFYHLPTLVWLDGVDVSSEELSQLVEGVVQRKKRFYRMKIHHMQMQAREMEARIKARVNEAKSKTYCKIREVQRQLRTKACSDTDQQPVLTKAMTALDSHMRRLESQCSSECESVWGRARELCERWSTELESGGNVKFIPGSSSQSWYQSCVDIVQSRLTITQGVSGVEVTGVTKVENRLQHVRFNEKMAAELNKEVFSSLSSWKTLLDYLFIVWEPGVACLDICCGHVTNTPPHVTNSVNLADPLRLAKLEKEKSSHEGELLLCKVFVGLTRETKSSQQPVVGEDVNCVCHVREGRQKEWFLRDPDLLLPEYIIQVKYSSSTSFVEHMMSCDPIIPSKCNSTHPRLAMLDEQTLLSRAGMDDLPSIKELCLCDNHLTRFRLAPSLISLVTLELSFNELATAEDFKNMPNLETLDISFNRLSTLEGLKGLPKLRSLNVQGNELTSAHEMCSVLRKQTPCLESLDLRYNPWNKLSTCRANILSSLKSIRVLNSVTVSQEEASAALKQVISSHLSPTTLMTHAHTHTHAPHSLTLRPLSQILHTDTDYRPSPLRPSDNWTHTVTSVCVDGVGLRKLSCLDQLPNLRWLSLAHNCLSSVDVVSTCHRLEELVLDDNYLHELPALHTLTRLTYLSLSDNNLTSLPSLLPQLTYLNFSFNKISSLDPLKPCVSLEELYASGNALFTTRQLFPLKSLTSLSVCDMTGNSVTVRSEYRHFIVYHCTSLKALDGSAVGTSEVVVAREKMGGRLCQDLIFEKNPDKDPNSFKQLDVTHCGIKVVDLSPVAVFDNLASLNLEHNSLTSFSGLMYLNSLKVLCLNHNRIEHLVSPRDAPSLSGPLMLSLQVLHLAYNGIRNLSALQLGKIPSLRALFLQGNEVSSVEGLEGLEQLLELVLDRNKIKSFQTTSFKSLTTLRELHVEENRLKDLSHLTPLVKLERLYLGMNKIQDFNQLEKLSPLCSLIELSVVSNPVSRRLQHRCLLVHLLPSLLSLDGVIVSAEERHNANTTFSTAQQEVEPALEIGLSHGALLKVMNVPFGHHYLSNQKKEMKQPSDRKRGK